MKEDDFMFRFIESCIRVNTDDVMQVYDKIPEEFSFTFLVALKVLHDGLLPTLNERDRQLYDKIMEHSETVVIKIPRKEEEP